MRKSSISHAFPHVKRCPATLESEMELGRRVQRGDGAALDELIVNNIPLVISLANRLSAKSGRDPDDLISAGLLGLLRAARGYDPRRRLRFGTYAVWWIRQAFQRHIIKDGLIGVPSYMQQIVRQMKRGERVTYVHRSIDPKLVDHADRAMHLGSGGYGRASEGQDFFDYIEICDSPVSREPEPGDDAARREEANLLKKRLCAAEQELNPRERRVIRCRFFVHPRLTLADVAERMNITRERVRQIEVSALDKMRKYLEEHS